MLPVWIPHLSVVRVLLLAGFPADVFSLGMTLLAIWGSADLGEARCDLKSTLYRVGEELTQPGGSTGLFKSQSRIIWGL